MDTLPSSDRWSRNALRAGDDTAIRVRFQRSTQRWRQCCDCASWSEPFSTSMYFIEFRCPLCVLFLFFSASHLRHAFTEYSVNAPFTPTVLPPWDCVVSFSALEMSDHCPFENDEVPRLGGLTAQRYGRTLRPKHCAVFVRLVV